jgi:hypothetical protein
LYKVISASTVSVSDHTMTPIVELLTPGCHCSGYNEKEMTKLRDTRHSNDILETLVFFFLLTIQQSTCLGTCRAH